MDIRSGFLNAVEEVRSSEEYVDNLVYAARSFFADREGSIRDDSKEGTILLRISPHSSHLSKIFRDREMGHRDALEGYVIEMSEIVGKGTYSHHEEVAVFINNLFAETYPSKMTNTFMEIVRRPL